MIMGNRADLLASSAERFGDNEEGGGEVSNARKKIVIVSGTSSRLATWSLISYVALTHNALIDFLSLSQPLLASSCSACFLFSDAFVPARNVPVGRKGSCGPC